MRKSSWMILAICGILTICLGFGYFVSKQKQPDLNQQNAEKMLQTMSEAVNKKDIGALLQYISSASDTKIANMKLDQLRIMLARGFRNTGKLVSTPSNIVLDPHYGEANLDFDLVVKSEDGNVVSDIYAGHITLKLRKIEVSHLLGLYHIAEWRIVGAEHTGRELDSFGDG